MIYQNQTVLSKSGDSLVLFADGTNMHSKYNPSREAESFGQEIPPQTGCIVVAGIGGGFHLLALQKKFPEALIIVCEADEQSLAFCKKIPLVQELVRNSHFIFCTATEVASILLQKYLPAFYNSFFFLPHRVWKDKNKSLTESLENEIQASLKKISADYSVQTHFGKIWQHSLFLNLKEYSNSGHSFCAGTIPLDKTAAVIAAGPSLNRTIHTLVNNKEKYYIIATDTSYGTLIKHSLIPDAVVSLDGQYVSATHFYCCPQNEIPGKGTLFFFDLSGSPAAIHHVLSKGYRVIYFQSGHPLASYAFPSLPLIHTGSGTVTIACCDIAAQLGFKRIALFGADFCYSGGKSYAQGTYLDSLYNRAANRLQPSETQFDSLLFRTPLFALDRQTTFSGTLSNARSTDVLKGYEETLVSWAAENGFSTQNNILFRGKSSATFSQPDFSYAAFIKLYLKELKPCADTAADAALQNTVVQTVLPYTAWLRAHNSEKTDLSFFRLIKLAYSDAVRYT